MTARHILTFAQSLDGGGVESAQLRLAADWLAAGRRVTLILGTSRGPLASEIPPGLRVIERGAAAYLAMFDLPRYVAALAPDVLFCPGNHYTSVAAGAWLELGAACPPVVAKLSNTVARADHAALVARGYRAWAHFHPCFIDHLVAMTRGMADEARRLMGFPADRVSVIPNPPARHVVDEMPLKLPEDRFILGIGRLERQKRWDRLILAMRSIRAADAKLVILGEGTLRPALERLAAEHGLEDRVSLPGHRLDPRPAMRRASAVALVSDYEGVPGVLREALSLGTPVVTTDSSIAIREIVTCPSQGDIVSPDDPSALAAALDRRLDPARPRPMPTEAVQTCAAGDYLDLFDQLLPRGASHNHVSRRHGPTG
ncbi:glycosyltransferase involved in cell wall biosynthesis [Hephaestia caeni]|uniref:Glycosyltransferase involved in cell wall biosynthesis n=1 Tax=Hephaestia caeni TaxID=645617 RepID=A0A397PCW7_9SPHN|nr:glycosyltransferase [Hephaestia caeni]RIA45759.1 glycosyltransferase involved in cell wall biosynthesis [Hephaestia caeni]